MAQLPYPCIVVPGITATYIQDEYVLPPEVVWSVKSRDYERAGLHPDNPKYESRGPARLVPGQLFEVAYRELIQELRFNLRAKEDQPVPVFPFSYDWRQPLAETEIKLAAFIDEVIERTKLLRHYDRSDYGSDPRVNLVGHSMGGLVIAGYIERSGSKHKAYKVATLATPFQGSFEAVVKITTGTANLGRSEPSSREREAARLTPALYQLLPSFKGGIETDDGTEPSLFDVANWQQSIIDTLKEFIRLHGLGRSNRDQQARDLFTSLLKRAAEHRRRIETLDLARAGMKPEQWLCVVGVNAETRVRLGIMTAGRAKEFSFRSAHLQNLWEESDPKQRLLTGDGTVPLQGAIPSFLPLEALVCVSADDFGYWEVQDKLYADVAGFHGILPNMDMLHRLVVAHFSDRSAKHSNIWGQPAPGVVDWNPPVDGLRVRGSEA